jgi:phosphoadenosine phosphosulfate reductase
LEKMKIPYFGKNHLHWCPSCNLPVLGRLCGRCSGETVAVAIAPPGDIRPAFEKDIALINETVEAHFGSSLLPERGVVLLNRASGLERFDEVIAEGQVLGALRYDPRKRAHEFVPRPEGGRRIWARGGRRKYVEIDPSAESFILKGASVLLPGVLSFDPAIERDEEVLLLCREEVIGVGRSRISGKEARERGVFVKTRKAGRGGEASSGRIATWEEVLEANREILEGYEREALRFLREEAEKTDLPKVVAFSGGKDSLATLLLARKAIRDFTTVFIDTDVEFPETLSYVRRMEKDLGLHLVVGSSEGNFWRGAAYFGPPGRDYRWCCKVSKMGPTARVFHRLFPGGCLNFIGQRRYESEIRARSQKTWRNPWLPGQRAASPIQNWTALHVWLYLMRERVETNPLYREGMERIGCWLCPASDLSELERIEELHPELWQRWRQKLEESGYTEEAISLGAWRWRRLRPGHRELLRSVGCPVESGEAREVFSVSVTAFREGGGSWVAKGSLPLKDFEEVFHFAQTLGTANRENGSLSLGPARLTSQGQFHIEAGSREETLRWVRRLAGLVERAAHCLGCGTCLAQCPQKALEIEGGKARVTGECRGCSKCHVRCPIIRYGVQNRLALEGVDEEAGNP